MPNSSQMELILASGSPRRRELLERFYGKVGFRALAPDFDETKMNGQTLDDMLRRLPDGKLLALQQQFTLPDEYAAVAADTLVVLDGQIFGKPADAREAARMLEKLSGRVHEVKTGLSLIVLHRSECWKTWAVETTRVKFSVMDQKQIDWYVATGEPLDKAGAYGIQGFGAALVEWIDGCYYNVMGLPVFRLMTLLAQAASHFNLSPGLFRLLPWD
jgi:septum formation protein